MSVPPLDVRRMSLQIDSLIRSPASSPTAVERHHSQKNLRREERVQKVVEGYIRPVINRDLQSLHRSQHLSVELMAQKYFPELKYPTRGSRLLQVVKVHFPQEAPQEVTSSMALSNGLPPNFFENYSVGDVFSFYEKGSNIWYKVQLTYVSEDDFQAILEGDKKTSEVFAKSLLS